MDASPLTIRVECYAGYRGEQEPRAFTLGERRFTMLEILDRWLDPRHRYFKVKTDDGRRFILRMTRRRMPGNWQHWSARNGKHPRSAIRYRKRGVAKLSSWPSGSLMWK